MIIAPVSPVPGERTTEDHISFEVGSPHPHRIFGVFHRPLQNRQSRLGVVLLGGWSGTRVGPHGILVSAARDLADAGYPSLRFDYRGRGDSEGTQAEAHIGTMVEDAVAASIILSHEAGADRIILLGICAGAQVAMAASSHVPNLAGMALWSPPPFHPDRAAENTVSTKRQRSMLRQYGAKLFDSRSWQKLLHGRLQWNTIINVLSGAGDRKLAAAGDKASWAGPKPDEARYERALSQVSAPAIYVFGSNDPEAAGAQRYYERLRKPAASTRVHVISGANHSFYSVSWKREVIDTTLSWIETACAESSS